MSSGGTQQDKMGGIRSPFGSGYTQPRADSGNNNLLGFMRNFSQQQQPQLQPQPQPQPGMMYPGGSPGFYSGAQGVAQQIQPIKQAYLQPHVQPYTQPQPDMQYAGGSPSFNMFGGQYPSQMQVKPQPQPLQSPQAGGIASLLPYRQV